MLVNGLTLVASEKLFVDVVSIVSGIMVVVMMTVTSVMLIPSMTSTLRIISVYLVISVITNVSV